MPRLSSPKYFVSQLSRDAWRLSSSVHDTSLPFPTRKTSKLALCRQISRNMRAHVRSLQERRHVMTILAGAYYFILTPWPLKSIAIGWPLARYLLIGYFTEVKKCSGRDNCVTFSPVRTDWLAALLAEWPNRYAWSLLLLAIATVSHASAPIELTEWRPNIVPPDKLEPTIPSIYLSICLLTYPNVWSQWIVNSWQRSLSTLITNTSAISIHVQSSDALPQRTVSTVCLHHETHDRLHHWSHTVNRHGCAYHTNARTLSRKNGVPWECQKMTFKSNGLS